MYNMQRNYTLQNVKKKNIVNFCIHKYSYTMSFFPHITTTTNPRRHLNRKFNEWIWIYFQQSAFLVCLCSNGWRQLL